MLFHTHLGSLPKRKRQFLLVRKDKNRNIGFKFEQEAYERLEKKLTLRSAGEWNQFVEEMMGSKSLENLMLLLHKQDKGKSERGDRRSAQEGSG